MIRAMLIAFAAAVIITAWLDRPEPVRRVQTDYCIIDYRAGAKDEAGVVHFGWARGWGLCRDLDRYENT